MFLNCFRPIRVLFALSSILVCQLFVAGSERLWSTEPNWDEAWITSLQWLDNETLVAANSQGLLLRPGHVLRADVGTQPSGSGEETSSEKLPLTYEVLGEAESSVWSVVVRDAQIWASDYKGRVIGFGGDQPRLIDSGLRWMRTLVEVPGSTTGFLGGSEDGTLIEFSVDSDEPIRKLELADSAIFDIAFSPEAELFAAACGSGKIVVASWPQLEVQHTIEAGSQAIWSVYFSDQGRKLISGGADREIREWDIESLGEPGSETTSDSGSAAVSDNSPATEDTAAPSASEKVEESEEVEESKQVDGSDEPAEADGALDTEDSTEGEGDSESVDTPGLIAKTSDWITCLLPLPDSQLVAAGCMNGDIVLIETSHKISVQTIKAAKSAIWDLAISPDGKRLAAGTRKDGIVIIDDLAKWYDAGQAAAQAAVAE